MNIVICGVDGAYKTTVANKLSKKINIPVIKGSNFETAMGTNEELFEHYKAIADLDNKIIDRFIYSNLVYTKIYPGFTRITDEQKRQLENKMRENNTIIAYLTASSDVIIDRLKKRGDDYIETNKVADIIGMYNKVLSHAVIDGMNVYTFDTGILSSDDIVSQIELLLRIQGKVPDIECVSCRKSVKRENSYFNETHCFSCHQEILQELLKNE